MKAILRILASTLAAGCLSGCSTIVEGTSQKIAVTTSPPGGYCSLKRDGQVIATVPQTLAEVTVDKTKDDILINCVVAGYQPTSQYLHSGIATGTYGNIIAGGLVGWGVDSMTGADNEYPATVSLNMSPLPKDEAPASVAFVQAAPTPCTKEQADLKRLAQEQGYRFQANCY
jgi:hypothetical protein